MEGDGDTLRHPHLVSTHISIGLDLLRREQILRQRPLRVLPRPVFDEQDHLSCSSQRGRNGIGKPERHSRLVQAAVLPFRLCPKVQLFVKTWGYQPSGRVDVGVYRLEWRPDHSSY